jgi:hypothetical protein
MQSSLRLFKKLFGMKDVWKPMKGRGAGPVVLLMVGTAKRVVRESRITMTRIGRGESCTKHYQLSL